MTSYMSYNYKKPSSVYGGSTTDSRKKIKHFSYSHSDKIGKGFSSIVYKGTNDLTSNSVSKFRFCSSHQSNRYEGSKRLDK